MLQKVVIVGAGALGKCLAAILGKKVAVTVYERDSFVSEKLQRNGFVFREGKRSRIVRIKMVSSLDKLRSEKIDVLIFATKVMDLSSAVRACAKLDPRFIFLPQNGLFNIHKIKRSFKRAVVCRGVTTMACQESGPCNVALLYRGNVYLGGVGAKFVGGIFRKTGIKVKVFKSPQGAVWAKLIFSSVMNPLPVITGQGYDVLRKDLKIWELVRKAICEGREVSKTLGVRLAFDPLKLIQRVRHGDLAGIAYRGSVARDVLVGRPTEIDFMTGALTRRAREVGVKTPVLDHILSESNMKIALLTEEGYHP
ncbi:MAG: ketopantoate reductase family protein [Candidatus Omnitrophica bacterium]|nr:ketopantoate reductase family protein [Candidatus Omnitrophota bacterium]